MGRLNDFEADTGRAIVCCCCPGNAARSSSSGGNVSSPRGCAVARLGDKGGDPSADVVWDFACDLVEVTLSKSSSGTVPATACAAGL